MGWMVDVLWETPTPAPGLVSTNTGAMIGKVASVAGMQANPVRVSSTSELTATHGLATTDILVKAAGDFFSAGGSDLWVYAITDTSAVAAESGGDITLNYTGVADTWRSPYVPMTAVTSVWLWKKISGTYVKSKVACKNDTTEYTAEVDTNGTLTGNIVFVPYGETSGTPDDGPIWTSDGDAEEFVDMTAAATSGDYTTTAVLSISSMGAAFNALNIPGINFSAITFAYDQSLTQDTGSTISDVTFKYADANCYSGQGWLGDVLMGSTMVSTLNAAGKRCILTLGLPDGVRPGDLIHNLYANGTAYDTPDEVNYSTLKDVVGANKFVSLFVGRQTTDGSDLGANAMGSLMANTPRSTFKYYPMSGYSQTSFPLESELDVWDLACINTVAAMYYVNGSKTVVFGGNHTLGTGWEGKLNYVRCKNILTNKLIDNLQFMLAQRNTHYNVAGAYRTYDLIKATIDWAVFNGYVDSFDYVTVPMLPFLERESTLTSGEQVVLDAERATGVFSNITAAYGWDGDVEKVSINALVGA